MSIPPSPKHLEVEENNTSEKDEQSCPDAFLVLVTDIYKDSFQHLVKYLRRKFGVGPPPPEDIAQSAFERLITAKNANKTRNPKAYLWRTALNLAITEQRRQVVAQKHLENIQQAPQDKGYEDKFENVITNRTELERISELVMSMPPQRRRAFLLVKVDGLSQVEAAEKMGISRPAVTKHLSKALEAIMDESQRREENNE